MDLIPSFRSFPRMDSCVRDCALGSISDPFKRQPRCLEGSCVPRNFLRPLVWIPKLGATTRGTLGLLSI